MKRFALITLSLAFITACQSSPAIKSDEKITIPAESRQLIQVTTPHWEAQEGTLQRYEKTDQTWHKVGKPIAIILGRNGLAWGRGLHTIPSDTQNIKKEGDGKAPAGLFRLGHGFGYEALATDFPYSVYQRTDHCVDDSRSKWYNRIVDSIKVSQDYQSFEHMKLDQSIEYKYGITVEHNPHQVPYGGSCIFMHIKHPSGKATSGCTAMQENEMAEVLGWLKSEANPLLLQLPQDEMNKRVRLE